MMWLTGVDMWDLYSAKIINLAVLGTNYKMSSVSHVYLPTNEQRLKSVFINYIYYSQE